eukprot:TRINITY_DN4666_c0_g3_i1.p1 TRINITY_DN4666_c0_g3~~TRINITY_DN4666_c0_g3_i1.p1  ORF type:complete len:249 (-),score=65.10 TRINITY_DN4666_c0_g3_i1:293-1039(-)
MSNYQYNNQYGAYVPPNAYPPQNISPLFPSRIYSNPEAQARAAPAPAPAPAPYVSPIFPSQVVDRSRDIPQSTYPPTYSPYSAPGPQTQPQTPAPTTTTQTPSTNFVDLPPLIVHKVTISDTMEGICLQYNVTPDQVRKANNLYNNDVYYRKELVIPNPKSNHALEQDEAELERIRRKHILNHFIDAMDPTERSEKTAKYYLESHNYDLTLAMREYKEDLKFEEQNKRVGNGPQTLAMKLLQIHCESV